MVDTLVLGTSAEMCEGSSPFIGTNRRLAQLVRAFGLHPKGHRFESYIFYKEQVPVSRKGVFRK